MSMSVLSVAGACNINSCQNAGVCTDLEIGYQCACAVGFDGGNCEISKYSVIHKIIYLSTKWVTAWLIVLSYYLTIKVS